LVTMAMATILNFFNPQKLPHTMVDIPTKWIIIWLPNHGCQFPTPKSTWKRNFACVAAFGGLKKILNGGRCHGNQGTKWPPNTKILRFGRNLVSK
jgi:hypothetical protein